MSSYNESINIEQKIDPIVSGQAITFAHKKNISRPNQHSMHLNDHIEIYIYISGDTHYVIEDKYYTLSHGDILIIPPYCTHVPVLKSEYEYERFYLLFPINSLAAYKHSPLKDILNRKYAHGFKPYLSGEDKASVLNLLYRISNLSENGESPYRELLLHALVLEFISFLSIKSSKYENSTFESHSLPPLIKNVLTFISQSHTEIESVSSIVEKFYVSQPYLSTVFKKYVGVSIHSYLQAKKISTAKLLLENGSSVTAACFECGFSDSSYFIKIFKRYVGVTPKKYSERFFSNKQI